MNEQEVQVIKDHIALVLKKETPNRLKELTIKDLQVPFIADPKMPPGEIKIVPQNPFITDQAVIRCTRQLGGRCACFICNPPLISPFITC